MIVGGAGAGEGGRWRFAASPRFEPFLALQALGDPAAPASEARRALWRRLGRPTRDAIRELGRVPHVWAVVADAPGLVPLDAGFDAVLVALRALPPEEFRLRVLDGALHVDRVVRALVRGWDMETALRLAPIAKREWYGYLGLYPFDPASPAAAMLRRLVDDPGAVRDACADILDRFWRQAFAPWWRAAEPRFVDSARRREEQFREIGLGPFAERVGLRIVVDEARGVIGAMRGGYELRLSDMAYAAFLPSAFNTARLWTCFPVEGGRMAAFFPYLEPSLAGPGSAAETAPDLDLPLVLKALGDSTRYGVVALLARGPSTAAALARALGVTPATMSHHVTILREAGVIGPIDAGEGRPSAVALRRETLEALTPLVRAQLLREGPAPAVRRSRAPRRRGGRAA
jgi:DNA-binding transcriptional ArsR family regulator